MARLLFKVGAHLLYLLECIPASASGRCKVGAPLWLINAVVTYAKDRGGWRRVRHGRPSESCHGSLQTYLANQGLLLTRLVSMCLFDGCILFATGTRCVL